MWPPTMSVRPSRKLDVPAAEQVASVRHRREDAGRADSRAARSSSAAPKPSSEKTSPVGVSDMWTATIGHANGALQSPMTFGRVARRSARAAELDERREHREHREHAALPRGNPAPESIGVCRSSSAWSVRSAPLAEALVIPRCAEQRTRAGSSDRPIHASGFDERGEPASRAAPFRSPSRAATRSAASATPHAAIGTKTSSSRNALKTGRREHVAEREDGAGRTSASSSRLRVSRRRQTSSSSARTPPTRKSAVYHSPRRRKPTFARRSSTSAPG